MKINGMCCDALGCRQTIQATIDDMQHRLDIAHAALAQLATYPAPGEDVLHQRILLANQALVAIQPGGK